ncbi:MAG: hypothetical protein ACOY4R_14225 [Pseudomonadota bacterium]
MALIGLDIVNEITIGAAGPDQVVITRRGNGDIQFTVGSEVSSQRIYRTSRMEPSTVLTELVKRLDAAVNV